MSSAVLLSQRAEEFIDGNVHTEKVYSRIMDTLGILAQYPFFGKAYDPEYLASRPPVPCRCLSIADTPFTAYYTYDIDADTVTVLTIEWSAGNPSRRFSGTR